MPQIDRLLEQHRVGNHPPRDEIPSGPHVMPVLHRGYAEWRGVRALGDEAPGQDGGAGRGDKGEHERGPLEEPEGVLGGFVSPSLYWAELGFCEHCVDVGFGVLQSG